jgi:hypothetical protein
MATIVMGACSSDVETGAIITGCRCNTCKKPWIAFGMIFVSAGLMAISLTCHLIKLMAIKPADTKIMPMLMSMPGMRCQIGF